MSVKVQTLFDTKTRSAFLLTNLGTEETDVIKIDVSTLAGAANTGADRVSINKIAWNISSGNNESVDIIWSSSSANSRAIILNNLGNWNLIGADWHSPIQNDATNPTGDIQLTTNNFNANSCYSILLEIKKTSGFLGT